MPTAAASGSGEPPERSDYGAQRTLPRSGLLEHAIVGEPQQRRCRCFDSLNGGVGRLHGACGQCTAGTVVGRCCTNHRLVPGLSVAEGWSHRGRASSNAAVLVAGRFSAIFVALLSWED
jgi:hypothetical protein